MSKASEWALALGEQQDRRPSSLNLKNKMKVEQRQKDVLQFLVRDDGELSIGAEQHGNLFIYFLSVRDALDLRDWLTETFDDVQK